MHISWLGTTALKLQTKHLETEATVVIDPYKPDKGSFPRSLTADIVLYTRGEEGSVTVSGDPFVLSTAGESETKGVLMTAADTQQEGQIVVRVDAEEMSIGTLGLTKQAPTKQALDVLTGVDILAIPVGHPDGLSAEQAVKVVNLIEPRVVLPIAFQSDTDPKAAPVDEFLKEIGSKAEPEKKVILKKKDLPQEDTLVILLEKE